MTADGRTTTIAAAGPLATDTVWDADTVRVTGDVFVNDGSTLSIAPGVRVLFEGWYSIFVRGRLEAVGTAAAPIVLDSAHPDMWRPDSSLLGAWSGLRFDATRAANGVSRIEWCDVAHTKGLAGRDRGGAVSVIACSNVQVRNSIFHHNAAQYGAVVYCERMANPLLAGNLMVDNYAFTGGSVAYCIDSYPRLFQNTIARNTCLNADGSYATGAIHNHMGKAYLSGSIVYGNASHYFLPGQMREAKAFCVRHCDVQYGIAGEGDFDADPLFRGTGEHPFALTWGSPCRDAGPADTTGQGLVPVDLAGGSRIGGVRIDVGAYESTIPADVALAAGTGTGSIRLDVAPNPTTRPLSVAVTLRALSDRVRVRVLDAAGRELRSLHDGPLPSGTTRLSWDGRCVRGRFAPAGAYWILVVDADGQTGARFVLAD